MTCGVYLPIGGKKKVIPGILLIPTWDFSFIKVDLGWKPTYMLLVLSLMMLFSSLEKGFPSGRKKP